jgi:hypothetical protein
MGMTVDDHIEVLKSYHHGFTGCAGNLQDSIDVAVDIMRKYQKIEQIINEYNLQLWNNTSDGAYNFQRIREVVEDGKID